MLPTHTRTRTLSSENSAAPDNGLMNVKPSVTYATGVAHMQTTIYVYTLTRAHTRGLVVSIFVN